MHRVQLHSGTVSPVFGQFDIASYNVAEATVFALPAENRCICGPPLAVPAGLRGCAAVVIGVIDIGTNTTRLLVAEVRDGRLRPKLERRHFLSAVSEEEAGALPGLVEREAAIARESGAEALISAGYGGAARNPGSQGIGSGLRPDRRRRAEDPQPGRGGGARLPRRHFLRARRTSAVGGRRRRRRRLDRGRGGDSGATTGLVGVAAGGLARVDRTGAALGPSHPRSDGRRPQRGRPPLRRSGAAGLRAGAGRGRRGDVVAADLGRQPSTGL